MTVTADPTSKAVPPPAIPTEEEMVLLHKCKIAYQSARDAKKSVYPNWRRNWLLVNNRMWSDFRQSWMPAPTDSEIYPIMANLIGWLTDQSVVYTLQPAALPGTPWAKYLEDLADELESLLQSNWKVRNTQGVVTHSMWEAGLYGAGILKTVWDQSLEKGMGDAALVNVDPWNFYPDPMATNEEDAEYLCEVRRMSWDDVERRFPDTCDRLLGDLVYDTSDSDLDSDQKSTNTKTGANQFPLSQSKGYPNAKTSSTGMPGQSRIVAAKPQGIVIYEMWTKENRTTQIPDPNWNQEENQGKEAPDVDVIYDEWRVVVYSSNTILLDAWASELWDGANHPYSRFCFEDTGEFWPTPLVSHLASPQIAINRLLAALQQSAELTGNPIFVEPSTSGISQSLLTNRPGQRLKVNPMSMANGGGPHWMPPPAMSQDVLGLIQFYIERMENISGLSTISKGKSPQGRAPESVVNQVQESGFIRVRSMLRNLERCLRRAGEIQAQLIVENYTEARTVAIIGPEGGKMAVALRERHFIDAVDNEYAPFKYSLLVNAGSEVPTSRQARVSEAQNMFLTKLIDRTAALEMMNVPHWPAIDQRMQQAEQQAAEQAKQANARQRTGRKS